jgi:hypothetical protein
MRGLVVDLHYNQPTLVIGYNNIGPMQVKLSI